MEPLNEDERHDAYAAVDHTTMILLEPRVMTATVEAVEAMENAIGLMIDRGLERGAAAGAILGAVIQRLVQPL